jgi:polysaccharide biosynthesis transport protein
MTESRQTTLSLRHYLAVLWRRKLIVIVCTLVVPTLVVGFSLTQAKRYRGIARVMVESQSSTLSAASGTNFDAGAPDDREIQTLTSLVVTPEMTQRALDSLGWEDSPNSIMKYVTATGDTGANIISIQAELDSPQRSRDLANAYAQSFVDWRREEQQRSLSEAIGLVDRQLENTARGTAAYLALTERRGQLEVLKTLTTAGVSVGEAAQAPAAPSQPRPKRDGAMALMGGFILGVGLAFLREALDIKVHTVDELQELTQLPVIAEIPDLRRHEREPGKIIALADPRGRAAESYRFLRTNLEFLNFAHDLKTVLVTSPLPSEGKSTTIANLAVVLLRSGKRVTIVEGDLRRPAVHRYFNLPGALGVTSVVSGATTVDEAMHVLALHEGAEPESPREVVPGQTSSGGVLNLRLLTSGPVPPNPGEIVSSKRFADLLDELAKDADYVLVDAPPLLAVGDASALAGWVDGVVVVLLMQDVTRPMVASVEAFLDRVPARTLGLVVTGAPRRASGRGEKYTAYYD